MYTLYFLSFKKVTAAWKIHLELIIIKFSFRKQWTGTKDTQFMTYTEKLWLSLYYPNPTEC